MLSELQAVQARDAGLRGYGIAGAGFVFRFHSTRSAGFCVCGEETALVTTDAYDSVAEHPELKACAVPVEKAG
ncbi:MAG: hypothetical protein HYX93_00140 [Chloroflexi bacterium]|nr:hypothetical protein [Chloroflexota bacterium]